MKDPGFREFFTFSRGEKNGIMLLLVIILLSFLGTYFMDFFYKPDIIDQNTIKALDSFFVALSSSQEETQTNSNLFEHEAIPIKGPIDYFMFDPNSIKSEDLVKLGFTFKQAQVFIRYRDKGGKFYKPEDLRKLYVVDSITYLRLKPYIFIDSSQFKNEKMSAGSSLVTTPIELNSTDSIQLIKIKGIGNIYAHRILAYRELVGGYVKLEQLKEVWGLTDDFIVSVSRQLWVDSTKIRYININLVSYEELKKHPYVTDFQAKGIIYYRNKVGVFKSSKELLQQKLLPEDRYQKIKPYLILN